MTMTPPRRTVHGQTVGIIVLDTGFARLPGDIAHADTWPFPVQFRIVRGVRPTDVIEGDPRVALSAFREAIDDLVALGAGAITTSCGFLAAVQDELTHHSPVPFFSSALLQIPLVARTLPHGQRVGLIVSDAAALQERHFRNVGAEPGLPMGELPFDGPIRANMRGNAQSVDPAAQERDALETVETLLATHPDIGALVLECANLPPYSAAIARRFGRPVYDIVTLVHWMRGAMVPPRYPA
ncbi:aspartate/glutamate racemase family protein [Salipiger sp. P9]|uniref:aspartate/glutamate racemase family protein n=1 Tax=Salipiger pentaromativorans TaxID=2943193 RepID=UPI0021578D88|nr:aspartate/glutamate racemase family protein [Salipiger pentaromativorans]MCR8548902.1 aspartate/glutamate racemase family protein [Salipiger pentaromativorans]